MWSRSACAFAAGKGRFGVARGGAGIMVVCAPRGAGKSHYLARVVEAERSNGAVVHWVDAAQAEASPPSGPADLVVIDDVDPRVADHVGLVRSAVASHRRGDIGRVVFASRSATLTDHHRFSWLHSFTTVRAQDLALDLRGIGAVARRRGTRVTGSAATVIQDESEGWAWAALVGLTAARELGDPNPEDLRREIRARIRAASVKELSDERRLAFTAAAAIVPGLLAALDLGIRDPAAWLDAAEADGWLERDSAESRYRVPQALSNALRSRDDETPEALAAVRERLTRHLLSETRIAEAIDVAATANTADLAVDVLHRVAGLGRFGDLSHVARVLKGRNLDWFGNHYDLLGAAILADRGNNRVYADWQQAAIDVVTMAPPPIKTPIDLITFDTVTIILHRVIGDLRTSTERAEHLTKVWQRARTHAPHLAGAAAIGLDAAAITFFYGGERRRSIIAETEALNCTSTLEDRSMRRVSATTLAGLQALHGDMTAAAAALGRLPALSDTPIPVYTRAWEHMSRALTDVEHVDLVRARASALDAVRTTQEVDSWWLTEYVRAFVEHAAGARHASHIYGRAIAEGQARGWRVHVPEFHRLCRYELMVLDGSIAAARAALAADSTRSRYAQLLRGVTDLALGDWSSAHRRAAAEGPDSTPRAVVLRGLVIAASSAATNQTSTAAEHLEATIDRMMEWGLASPLRFLTREARHLLTSTARELASDKRRFLSGRLAVHAPLPLARSASTPLTGREVEVLALLSLGSSRPEMAEQLGVSINTVKTLTRRIYQKLGARSRDEALNHAAQAGYLSVSRA